MLDYNELFYLKEYVPMANNYVFNDILPVAPLKLAALESCKDLATKVNDHIVTFRRNDTVELLRRQQDLNYRGYDVDSYLLDCKCPRFGSVCNGRCNQLQHPIQRLRLHQSHVPG